MYKRNSQGWLKHIDFIILDILALEIAYVSAYFFRQHASFFYFSSTYRNLAVVFAVVDILISATFNTMHEVLRRESYKEFIQSFKQASLVLIVMMFYMFSVQSGDSYSRITIYLTSILHFILGYSSRFLWRSVLKKIGKERSKSTMILVAEEKQIPEILASVSQTDDIEYTGLVLSNRDAEGEEIGGIKVVANISNAADYICREWVDEVFVYPVHLTDIEVHSSPSYKKVEGFIDSSYKNKKTEKNHEEIKIEEPKEIKEITVATLIEQCRQMAVPVHIRLPIANIGGKSFVEKICGYNVLTIASNFATPLQLAMKRLIDIAGGIVGSFIALIIMLIVAPMIKKESPGPILFKQTRIGQNGKKFQIYKIRSMYEDAEERKKELLKNNRVSGDLMFKLDWDPRIIGNKIVNNQRVTGIGEKLRAGSWDEWPQFFNVLMGHMSLIGTRPPTVDEWEKYKYHHRARLATKPGITGMWQVNGRSKITDFEEVVRLDTEYINHWSIALDLKILLKTFKVVFLKDGAM